MLPWPGLCLSNNRCNALKLSCNCQGIDSTLRHHVAATTEHGRDAARSWTDQVVTLDGLHCIHLEHSYSCMGAVISLLHKRIVGSHFAFKCLKHLLGAHTFTPSQANLSLCLILLTHLSVHSN